jgi:C4-dicarboxylate transporter, DctM subunit
LGAGAGDAVGFLLIALRAIRGAGASGVIVWPPRCFCWRRWILNFAPRPEGPAILWIGIGVIIAGAVLGLPIFATLGGVALLLFWNIGQPAVEVPDNAYSLMVSEVLPSLPLYTLAGYLLVEGGASTRLLRVYAALFGWLPGGLAITTAITFAIFTFAGSGVTIVSMGGLMLPMLLKARYTKQFSIGLINGSGSLGLLFPPSLPVILYAIYAKTVQIDTLFVGGLVPGLLMVAMVSAWGVYQGVKSGAERRGSPGRRRARPFGRQMGIGAPGDRHRRAVRRVRHAGGGRRHRGRLLLHRRVLDLREFSLRRDFPRVAVECVTVVGGVLLIIGVAKGLTYYLAIQDVPGILTNWVDLPTSIPSTSSCCCSTSCC